MQKLIVIVVAIVTLSVRSEWVIASAAQSPASITISDFPQYGTQLDGAQREDLRSFARGLVGAALTGTTVTVFITGHADFDNKPTVDVNQVSRDRAKGAETALRSLVDEEAAKASVSQAQLQLLQYQVAGVGTSKPVFGPPKYDSNQLTPDQRKANRRVVLTWAATPAPPRPTPPPPPSSTNFEIRVVGGFSAAAILQADNYFFQIVDLTTRQTAFFWYTGGGVGVGIPKIPGPGSATKAGPPTKFTTNRPTQLHQFNSRASLFQDPGGTLGGLTVGGTLRLAISEIVDATGVLIPTRPDIIPIEGGPGIQMPSLGSASDGVLVLMSAVFPFNGY